MRYEHGTLERTRSATLYGTEVMVARRSPTVSVLYEENKKNQDGQCTCNVTMRPVRVTDVTVEMQ